MAQLQWLWCVVIAIPVSLCLRQAISHQKTGKIAESGNFYTIIKKHFSVYKKGGVKRQGGQEVMSIN